MEAAEETGFCVLQITFWYQAQMTASLPRIQQLTELWSMASIMQGDGYLRKVSCLF